MLRTTYKHLNNVQKGSLGEAFSKMAFTLEGFEVYGSEYDDRGVDFIVRNGSGRFFDVQVKATDESSNPFIKKSKFRESDDFIFCAVRVVEDENLSLYIARGSDWASDFDCLNYNADGGSSGPYYEIRFSARYREQLAQFEFQSYVEKFRT